MVNQLGKSGKAQGTRYISYALSVIILYTLVEYLFPRRAPLGDCSCMSNEF